MCGRAGDGEAPDEPVLLIDRDMRMVAKHRDDDLTPDFGAVRLRRTGPGPPQGEAGAAILLPELVWLGSPDLWDPALLAGHLLCAGVAWARSRDDRGADDLLTPSAPGLPTCSNKRLNQPVTQSLNVSVRASGSRGWQIPSGSTVRPLMRIERRRLAGWRRAVIMKTSYDPVHCPPEL